jgi:hypothetical protein
MIVQMDTVGRKKLVAIAQPGAHTAAFDGTAQQPMERAVAATRKPHAHCITRVTNASGIEFRNEQRRDEQHGVASCTMFSAVRREDSNLGMAESKSNWFALTIKVRSEKSRKFDLNPFKRYPCPSQESYPRVSMM